eukprot:6490233-Amphidinium_carterae.4
MHAAQVPDTTNKGDAMQDRHQLESAKTYPVVFLKASYRCVLHAYGHSLQGLALPDAQAIAVEHYIAQSSGGAGTNAASANANGVDALAGASLSPSCSVPARLVRIGEPTAMSCHPCRLPTTIHIEGADRC